MIRRSVASGRLRPVLRGIYAVAHVALRRESWWMAALLACGPGSALSHRSAATLWHLRTDPMFAVDITASTKRGRKRARITTHRTRLGAFATVVIDGLRVTTPSRALAGLATVLDGHALRGAVERPQDLRRFDAGDIRRRSPMPAAGRALAGSRSSSRCSDPTRRTPAAISSASSLHGAQDRAAEADRP